jgi:hypothetical protein
MYAILMACSRRSLMRYDAVSGAVIKYLAGVDAGVTVSRKALREVVEARHPGAIAREVERLKREQFESRFTGNPPTWAKHFVSKYGSSVDEVVWRRSKVKWYSSGHCYIGCGRLVVTAGPEIDEQKVVLLHELTHARVGVRRYVGPQPSGRRKRKWASHDDRFYDELYRLVKAEGLYRAALSRESSSLRAAARRARASA